MQHSPPRSTNNTMGRPLGSGASGGANSRQPCALLESKTTAPLRVPPYSGTPNCKQHKWHKMTESLVLQQAQAGCCRQSREDSAAPLASRWECQRALTSPTAVSIEPAMAGCRMRMLPFSTTNEAPRAAAGAASRLSASRLAARSAAVDAWRMTATCWPAAIVRLCASRVVAMETACRAPRLS